MVQVMPTRQRLPIAKNPPYLTAATGTQHEQVKVTIAFEHIGCAMEMGDFLILTFEKTYTKRCGISKYAHTFEYPKNSYIVCLLCRLK
jgi:hypothetical protein